MRIGLIMLGIIVCVGLLTIIDFIDPETGETVKVDACFEEVDGKWQEIGKKKWYELRKKHAERLATALRAKEEH